jgi:hypothetical protein
MDARQSVMPVTAPLVLPLSLDRDQTRANGQVRMAVYARGCTMDATYFRDKAETCLRLAKGLSWNNPARGELMELAERPRNSKPRRNSLVADADFFSAFLRPKPTGWQLPSAHYVEKFSFIFKFFAANSSLQSVHVWREFFAHD